MWGSKTPKVPPFPNGRRPSLFRIPRETITRRDPERGKGKGKGATPPLLRWQWGTAWIATAEMAVGARIAGRHCCDGSGGYAARGVSRRHAGYALRVATAVLAVGARQKSPPPRWWRRRGTHCLNDNDDNGIRTHHAADRAVSARTAAVRQTSNDGMAVVAHARAPPSRRRAHARRTLGVTPAGPDGMRRLGK